MTIIEKEKEILYIFLRSCGWAWELNWQKQINRRKAYNFYLIFLCVHESSHSVSSETTSGITSGIIPDLGLATSGLEFGKERVQRQGTRIEGENLFRISLS